MDNSTLAINVALVSAWVLVITSIFVALLYLVRVARHRGDPLRWALFGVLISTALNLLPLLLFYYGHPTSIWVGTGIRVFSLAALIITVEPLLKDTWHEVCATLRVARDSWKLFKPRD
jgi:hypothetical protein